MTPGTSPRSPWTPFAGWTAAGKHMHRAQVRLRRKWRQLRLDGPELARPAAILYLVGLGIALATAWSAPADAAGEAVAGFPTWHLAFLMTTGAAAAILILAGRESAEAMPAGEAARTASGVSLLMAQMSHELRTPLNAVIGFSDVMLRELHGPLGNVRYQEYAHHISESGGRLLKSSEEALAVTEAMTALMADRRRGKRERVSAAALLREAWRAAIPALGNGRQRLALTTCATCDVLCERRPTVQALEHLLREALGRMPGGGTVEVTGRRDGGRRGLEIEVRRAGAEEAGCPASGLPHAAKANRSEADGSASLRIILARLLLEVQGARLTCGTRDDGTWAARIEFAGRG